MDTRTRLRTILTRRSSFIGLLLIASLFCGWLSTTAAYAAPGSHDAHQMGQHMHANDGPHGNGPGGGPGRGGPGGPGMCQPGSCIDGAFVSATATSLTITTPDGKSCNITVNAQTVYTKAGQPITINDFKAGDHLHIQFVPGSAKGSSPTAARVDVVPDHVEGIITQMSGTTLTITDPDKKVHTVTVSNNTTYFRLGQQVTQSALAQGELIHAEGTFAADGSLAAQTIRIDVPQVEGLVTALYGSTLTINGPNKPFTVVTTNATQFVRAGQAASLSDVKVGSHIQAAGTVTGTTMTADLVIIQLPLVEGKVTAINSGTYTLTSRDGSSHSITMTANTVVLIDGLPGTPSTTGTLSDIKVGSLIGAGGTPNADGSFTALLIHVHPAPR